MNNYRRNYPLFSLCGLNCGLCTMHLDNYCPGCGGGAGNQPCGIIRCTMQHGGMEYCYLCDKYPCEKYNAVHEFDSFITHRNQLKDFERVKKIGIDNYQAELEEKINILRNLLDNYNDGRRKSFFCIAINLLELQDIKSVMEQIATDTESDMLKLKEKAGIAVSQFQAMAERRNVILKLNKKAK